MDGCERQQNTIKPLKVTISVFVNSEKRMTANSFTYGEELIS